MHRLSSSPTSPARPLLALLVAGVVLLGACTSGDEPDALAFDDSEESSEEGTSIATESAQDVDQEPAPGLDGLEAAWAGAAADPDLAECYRSVLEKAGLGEHIRTLEDAVAAQETLTDEQREQFNDCLDLVN